LAIRVQRPTEKGQLRDVELHPTEDVCRRLRHARYNAEQSCCFEGIGVVTDEPEDSLHGADAGAIRGGGAPLCLR
jgi:hypothetical protein